MKTVYHYQDKQDPGKSLTLYEEDQELLDILYDEVIANCERKDRKRELEASTSRVRTQVEETPPASSRVDTKSTRRVVKSASEAALKRVGSDRKRRDE